MIQKKRFDIPFSSDIGISVILSIMLMMTCLSLFTSFRLNTYIQDWNTASDRTFTVEIPYKARHGLPLILKKLKESEEIEYIKGVDQTYVDTLMTEFGVSDEEAPALFDIVISKSHRLKFDPDKFLKKLRGIADDVNLIRPILTSPETLSLTKFIEKVSFGFGLTIMAFMGFTVMFLIYSEIHTHARTIYLFNLLGAPNYYISKIFQRYISKILLKACLGYGLLMGILSCGIYTVYPEEFLYLVWNVHWISLTYIMLGVPLLMVMIIKILVPITVLICLRKRYQMSLHP